VLKFGRPQLQQYQLALDCSSGSYITVFIWRQFLWYHFSQPVQAIERIVRDHLHALPHISHGYFIGPPNFNTSLFEDFEIHTYSLSSNLNETSTSINDYPKHYKHWTTSMYLITYY
jgi:hypothetical protein